MNIDLKNINDDEEIALAHDYDAIKEELEYDDCHYMKPIHLAGIGIKQDEVFVLKGQITSECEVSCSRCLNRFVFTIDDSVDFIFDIKGKMNINITNDIREQVIFLHNQKYLCKSDCAGICSHCGQDLNKNACSCDGTMHDESKFAELKKFLKKEEKEK